MKQSARKIRSDRKNRGTGKFTIHAPNNPIVVNPKTHRAKGQAIAPPAPRIEVKPPYVPLQRTDKCVELHISRWSHGGVDLWNTPPKSTES